MNTSDAPEIAPENQAESGPAAQSDSIIFHTEEPEHEAGWFQKFVLFFKRKPIESPQDMNQVDAPAPEAPPIRSNGQGPSRKAKSGSKNPAPDMRLRAFMSPPMTLPPEPAPKKFNLRPTREKTRRAFWDVTGALSLIVNVVLIVVLFIMAGQIRNLKGAMDNLLGGLYSNFVELDKANISTTIPVNAQIPIVFSLPVKQNTEVTLTSAVTVPRTGVVINSGGLSINAPATITLPAGTSLPIALNLDIPVEVTIPIALQVPVDIPMSQSALHAPFTGLQQTIRPLYCTINKNAQYPQGIYICNQETTPTTGTP